MDLRSRLKALLSKRDASGDVRECRDCGTMVSPLEDACPNCESTRIAIYEI